MSSVLAMGPTAFDGDPIRTILSNPERKNEVDQLLSDCRDQVRNLLLKKRHVVEGIRDALLEREELIGDEIEALMAELGEREPLEMPVLPAAMSGNGQQGDGQGSGDGDGNGRRRVGEETEAPPPPPPFEP